MATHHVHARHERIVLLTPATDPSVYPLTDVEYLRHVPNYTRANDVDSVDVEPLDPDTFLHEIVNLDRA